jgi:hypothetical protein
MESVERVLVLESFTHLEFVVLVSIIISAIVLVGVNITPKSKYGFV